MTEQANMSHFLNIQLAHSDIRLHVYANNLLVTALNNCPETHPSSGLANKPLNLESSCEKSEVALK
jgi:hypothetical protein